MSDLRRELGFWDALTIGAGTMIGAISGIGIWLRQQVYYSYAALNIGCVALCASNPDWYKPTYRTPGTPWFQQFAAIGCITIIIFSGPFAQIARAMNADLKVLRLVKERTDIVAEENELKKTITQLPQKFENRPYLAGNDYKQMLQSSILVCWYLVSFKDQQMTARRRG